MRRRPLRLCAPLSLVGCLGALIACAGAPPEDPWSSLNRPTFAVNEGLDRVVLEPVATGWTRLLPDPVERAIGRVFDNLGTPWVGVNDLLQGKPVHATRDLARFAVNSSVGVLGLFDPATRLGLPERDEDFGQTLGVWGLPSGPYLVLPLLGPSSPRHTVGRIVDIAGNPLAYVRPRWIPWAAGGVEVVNLRARYLDAIRENREAALDYYVFVRDAYTQNRARHVIDELRPSEADADDLYDVDQEF